MNFIDLIKAMCKVKHITQKELSLKVGYGGECVVPNMLQNKHGIRSDNLLDILNALDCDIIVRDRTSGSEYVVTK